MYKYKYKLKQIKLKLKIQISVKPVFLDISTMINIKYKNIKKINRKGNTNTNTTEPILLDIRTIIQN